MLMINNQQLFVWESREFRLGLSMFSCHTRLEIPALIIMEAEPSSVVLRNSVGWAGRHFAQLRDNSQFCDVTLLCEDGASFPAHKVIDISRLCSLL